MRSLSCSVVVLLVSTYFVMGADSDSFAFDDASSAKAWKFHNGPEFPGAAGDLKWSETEGHDKAGYLALHYDFSNGGNYVQAISPDLVDGNLGAIHLWLKKSHAHSVTFRATDSAGQTFQKSIKYEYEGWQRIEVSMARWETWFGGPADGNLKPPIKRFGVMIENNAEPKSGDLFIDDIRCLPASSAAPPRISTLLASDFLGDPRWWPAGGKGNTLEKGVWQFAFNPSTAPAIHSHFSLLGKPVTLRLILDSQAPGTTISATMAGHFARFECEIGTLNGQAGQIIEVPLGDMKTWRRLTDWGADRVPLPLRMQSLSLKSGQGPQQGTVHLRRLEVDTELRPGLDVLALPEAWVENGQACFKVRVKNLTETDVQGTLHCRFADLNGTIGAETQPLPAIPRNGTHVAEFRKPLDGRPFMDATFQWIAPDRASPAVSMGVATEPSETTSAVLDPDSPMGMGLYMYRFNGWPGCNESLERTATLAQRAGIKWSREEFNWGRIEPQRGKFEWAFYDQMVDTARKHGINVYGLLAYWSTWTKPNTPEGIDDYCRYVTEVVRHFKDRVRYWEVWNEPNIGFWTGPREMYAQLLTRAYDAIKAEDPKAVVLGCSTAGIDKDFIRKTIELGGKFDELTIHPYRPHLYEDSFIRELRETRALAGDRRMWITEVGFSTQIGFGVSEREQASLIVRTYLAAIGSRAVANTCWYDFRNDGWDYFYNEENFGIVRNDFRPKPAYRALATLGQTIAGMSFREAIDIGPDAYAYRFENDRAGVIAVWAPTSGRLFAFESKGLDRVQDAMDVPLTVNTKAGSNILPLHAGFPIYLIGQPGMTFKSLPAPKLLSLSTCHVHPGNTVKIAPDPGVEVTDWQLPIGWDTPQRGSDGNYELKVPDTAVAGPVELNVQIQGQIRLCVPLLLSIEPDVLRL